ncbi:Ester hydrolase C11orf54-like protein [Armadillidium nasatum]|uniref:Ester hydrolase C11orf54-like protein n=1 Tax=Armadillidium nasatum TaxID=96803 RepID=A0A5N5TFN4_9CRUS|nr:Ester hydrolase C11orf54-like protein [Armadillidium nasatum]
MSIPVIKKQLQKLSLEEVSEVLSKGLKSNFAEVSVEVVQCPDLSKAPWELAAPGLGGSPRIAEAGGVRNLTPLPKFEKIYDMKELAKLVDLPNALLIGAGAGPFPYVGVNSELIPNLKANKPYSNQSRTVKLCDKNNEKTVLAKLPSDESRCGLMLNFYACEGSTGPVIKVKAKKRTGDDDLVGCMRKALAEAYGTKPVGVGGTFLMKTGTAKLHVMPDFSKVPLVTDEDVNNWLQYFLVQGPLLFMSVFLSHDPGLEFRLEHTHGYSNVDGGHYHYDTTPDEVEYEGYFNVAEFVYRIDKPN